MQIRLFYITLFLLFTTTIFSQKKERLSNEDLTMYKKEWSVGLRFHTNAISGFYEYVWIKDIKRRKVLQINIFGYMDYRDKKVETLIPFYQQDSKIKKYYYGKQNNFYSTQLMYGYRKVIANKSEISGVKLSFTYMAGVSLGILKPYYIKLYDFNDSGSLTDERFIEETKDAFLDKSKIVGVSPFGVGFNKIKFTPGVTAKIGLNFDFARKNSFITSIEVGSQIDVFLKKLNIYISENNKPYILNLYLSFQIGKRSA